MPKLDINTLKFPSTTTSSLAPPPLSLDSTTEEIYSLEHDWIKNQWEAYSQFMNQEGTTDEEKTALLQDFLNISHTHFMRNPSVYFNLHNTPIYKFLKQIATTLCNSQNTEPNAFALYEKMFGTLTLPYDPIAHKIYLIEYTWVAEQWKQKTSEQDFLDICSKRLARTRFGYFGDRYNPINQFIKKVAAELCRKEGIAHPNDRQLYQKMFRSFGQLTIYEPHPGWATQYFQHAILSTDMLKYRNGKFISLSDIVGLITDPQTGLFYYAYLFHGLKDLKLLPERVQQALTKRKEIPFLGSLLPEDRMRIKAILNHKKQITDFFNKI